VGNLTPKDKLHFSTCEVKMIPHRHGPGHMMDVWLHCKHGIATTGEQWNIFNQLLSQLHMGHTMVILCNLLHLFYIQQLLLKS